MNNNLKSKGKEVLRVLFAPLFTLGLGVMLLFAVASPMELAILNIEDDYAKAFASVIYAITMLQLVFRFVGFDMVHNFGKALQDAIDVVCDVERVDKYTPKYLKTE